MNKIQTAKQNSYLSIAGVFSANQTAVASLPSLADASETLNELLAEVDLNATIQSSASGASDAKQAALTTLADCAEQIAGAVHSFAEASGDFELAKRVDFSRTTLVSGSAAAIVARGKGILEAATEHLESLGDEGVTTAKLNAFKQAIKTYDGLRTTPRQARAARGAATKQLKRLFAKVDRLLENRIVRLMVQFKSSQPAFYDKFTAARAIANATGARTEKTPQVVPQPVLTPDAKAA